MNCQHQCSSSCRREGCNCDCPGEFHQTLEDVVEAYNQRVYKGAMTSHQKEIYRAMLEGRSNADSVAASWDKEWNKDYVYGFDEGENLEANEY